MGEASVQPAWERPRLEMLHIFQVLNNQGPYPREVNLLECLTQQALDVGMGMTLALRKALDHRIGVIPSGLAIRKDQTVFVIGIHPNNCTLGAQGRLWLLYHHIDEDTPLAPPQPEGFSHRPALGEQAMQVLCAVERDSQPGRSRSDQAQRIVEVQPNKRLQAQEMASTTL